MFYTIYKITNKINGKTYIGKHQTKNLEDGYMGSGKYLKSAITKHGIENFTKEILFVLDTEEEMNYIEKELVTIDFCESKNTYNICEGGQGGFSYINQNKLYGFSDPAVALKGRLTVNKILNDRLVNDKEYKERWLKSVTEANRKKIIDYGPVWTGKNHTEETKKKMSISSQGKNIGQNNGNFGKIWITNGVQNKMIYDNDIIPDGWYKGRKTK